jgi:hypothetical protein
VVRDLKPALTDHGYPCHCNSGESRWEALNAFVDGISAIKLSVSARQWSLIFKGLAWSGHRDAKSELSDQRRAFPHRFAITPGEPSSVITPLASKHQSADPSPAASRPSFEQPRLHPDTGAFACYRSGHCAKRAYRGSWCRMVSPQLAGTPKVGDMKGAKVQIATSQKTKLARPRIWYQASTRSLCTRSELSFGCVTRWLLGPAARGNRMTDVTLD